MRIKQPPRGRVTRSAGKRSKSDFEEERKIKRKRNVETARCVLLSQPLSLSLSLSIAVCAYACQKRMRPRKSHTHTSASILSTKGEEKERGKERKKSERMCVRICVCEKQKREREREREREERGFSSHLSTTPPFALSLSFFVSFSPFHLHFRRCVSVQLTLPHFFWRPRPLIFAPSLSSISFSRSHASIAAVPLLTSKVGGMTMELFATSIVWSAAIWPICQGS